MAPSRAAETADRITQRIYRVIADTAVLNKREAKALIKRLHEAYASANFGVDRHDDNLTLSQADVCRAFAELVAWEYGLPKLTHEEIEQQYGSA